MFVCRFFYFLFLSERWELSLTHARKIEGCTHTAFHNPLSSSFLCLRLLHSCTDFYKGLSISKEWQIHVC